MKTMEKTEEVEEDIVYHTEKPWNIHYVLMTIIAVLIILIFAFGPVEITHPKETFGDKDNKVPQWGLAVFLLSCYLLPWVCLALLAFICLGWVLRPQVEEKVEVELDNNNTYAVKLTDDAASKSRLKIFNCIVFALVAISVTMIFVVGLPDTTHPKDTLGAMDKDNKDPQWDDELTVFILSILLLVIILLVASIVNCSGLLILGLKAIRVEDNNNNNTSTEKSGRQTDDVGKKIRLKIINYICLLIFGVLIFVSCIDPFDFNEMSDEDKKTAGEVYRLVLAVTFLSCAVANIGPRILGDANNDDDDQPTSKWNLEYFVSEHLLEADEAKRKNLVLHKYLSKEKVYVYYDYSFTYV